MLSFWEKDHFLNYDHIIIGGGIVGLSTAVSLMEKAPNKRVLVLERGIFPTGASTKNAGFACFGSLTEIMVDLQKMSPEEVVNLVSTRWNGLQLLRKRLGDTAIDYRSYGGYELLSKDQLNALDKLDEVNDLLKPLFDQEVYRQANEKIEDFGFNQAHVSAVIFNPLEAQVHTGKMMKRLQQLATSMGVEVISGIEVEAFEEEENGVTVKAGGLSFRAENIALCTNAFTKNLLPETALAPGRGTVLVTKPVAGLKFKGTFHYEEGYYYFRNYEDKIIFGGGRNLAEAEEETTAFEINEKILNKLKHDLNEVVCPNQSVEIEHVWSGIMAFGPNKQPILKQHTDRVFMGVRLGGMGVAIGSQLGFDLADRMLQF
ncbi:NAD(P)/FAD-dependent oxidoreductase [Roseivirga pacifica]